VQKATHILVKVVELLPLLLVCRLHEGLRQLCCRVTARLLDLGKESLWFSDLGAFL
jgi:hypothetical protein